MIRMYFESMQDLEEVEEITGVKFIEFPDAVFESLRRQFDLNTDEYFIRFLKEIDNCDIPMRNVIRDLYTGDTHSFDRVSTGVKVLWLMARFPNKYLYPTQWLGENCYQAMFDLGKDRDIDVFEDSQMFTTEEIDECTGYFEDMLQKKVVQLDNEGGWDYVVEMGYIR